jgi:hypothetical protein
LKLNELLSVFVRVMPVEAAPKMSLFASLNCTLLSACSGWNTAGTLLASAFILRKSSLSTLIWLLTCASEMFCAAVL